MRKRYLIAYDIAEPKRLVKTHKKVIAYAIGGQKSFYECWLTSTELSELKLNIENIIDKNNDCFFIFQLVENTKPMLFGKASLPSTKPFLII